MSDEQAPEPSHRCPLELGARGAGRPRACDAEARTQELINSAGELFLEKGYAKVSLEMIARRARVAVRTIYVKFGGKSGLFREVLLSGRNAYFATMEDLGTNRRPIREVLIDFGVRIHHMLSSPTAIQLYRMVIAEAHRDPELAEAFFDAGPRQTREALHRFFIRPDVQSQFRADIPAEQLSIHLINCLMGDHLKRYLFNPHAASEREDLLLVEQRVDLFLRGAQR
ncbi:TetR/AcrR family transcriptional regulator [Pseudoduganella chitinolytica]|uniref:TetR/AcrR family transcriptional regulator n=1 Tax=Pseudoduganella chitinolytica TaxID=34070 RepID=A0ABY8BDN0_9BURK|nr:TetR/AcrR family transcriptional regulator [Pseudoduganella chitinolytica]WEF33081.1 TetR/AcrR family transcriptional regulator [Pseudoduganella chitinolytica]